MLKKVWEIRGQVKEFVDYRQIKYAIIYIIYNE
jgi:hypothetical protein